MSYINFNRDVAFDSTSGQMDAFNRVKTSEAFTQLDIRPVADELPEKLSKVTNGTGAGTFNTSNRTFQLSVAANNDYVIYQTFERGFYQSGKDLSPIMTGHNLQPVAGVVKRLGYFNTSTVAPYTASLDGILIETDDTKVYARVYNMGTLTDTKDITDVVTGTLTDWSKGEILRWDLQWLGKGKVRLFLVIGEVEYLIAAFYHANVIADPYMLSPNHSLRFEMRSTGGSATMNVQCLAVIQNNESDKTNNNISINSSNTVHSFPDQAAEYVALAVRLKSGYEELPIILNSFDVLGTSNDNIRVTIKLNVTHSGVLTFNGVTNKPVDFARGLDGVSGNKVTANTGIELFNAVGLANSFTNREVKLSRRIGMAIDGTRDVLYLCVTPLTAGWTGFTDLNLEQL